MWLLSTNRAELHHFLSPELVPGGYAILSHSWGKHEQSFKDTQDLATHCKTTGENPRDLATPKVRESCILAEQHGYQWIWNDTCCIDKTSSTELSEAINSMFRWYSLAEVCFAHMEGVESNPDVLNAPNSSFRTARWHTRGWTLQELIAPSLVIFVSQEWKKIGNKVELAHLLEEITGVPSRVLTREEHYSLLSIAERMSWASKRSTTRVEDEAYCLMGLFNVNMATIYGEGRQAFQRLQYEIVKQSFDTSLFAWGGSTRSETITPVEPQEVYELLNSSTQNHSYLLADSPTRFTKPWGRTVRYTPATADPLQPYLDWQWTKTNQNKPTHDVGVQRQSSVPFGGVELPEFSITSYGLKCRLPIIESDGLVVAVLLCDNGREHIGLFLHPTRDPVQDPRRKKYNTGYGLLNVGRYSGFVRLTSLGADLLNLRLNQKTVTAEWRDVFIADSPPPIERDVTPSLCSRLHSIAPAPPFRFPHWLISALAAKGMVLQRLEMQSVPVDGKPLCASATFEDINAKESVRVILGTCVGSASSTSVDSGRTSRWAKAIPQSAADWRRGVDDLHDCHEHHIDDWPRSMKTFGDAQRTVRLSFSRCKQTPEHTLAVHVELEGHVYDSLANQENVRTPPGEDSRLEQDNIAIECEGSPQLRESVDPELDPEDDSDGDWDLLFACRGAKRRPSHEARLRALREDHRKKKALDRANGVPPVRTKLGMSPELEAALRAEFPNAWFE